MSKHIKGMQLVLNNLLEESEKIKKGTDRGVGLAALLIKAEAQAITPIRLGNLVNSAYVVSSGTLQDPGGGGFVGPEGGAVAANHAATVGRAAAAVKMAGFWKAIAIVGYTARYALSVHENPEAGKGKAEVNPDAGAADNEKRSNPNVRLSTVHSKGGQWKFLETPLRDNAQTVKEIIRREAKRG